MSPARGGETRGTAVVAFMLVTVIILGSILMLHTAAVITIGGTSRALEIARQNAATGVRLEHSTREAAQSFYGTSATPCQRGLQEEINSIVGSTPLGLLELKSFKVSEYPSAPRMFPSLAGEVLPLGERSADLDLMASPELRAFAGARVVESSTFNIQYIFARKAVKSLQDYSLQVKCRLVAVPVSRFAVMPYDLPEEIGQASSPRPMVPSASSLIEGPRGLVPSRDPASISSLSVGLKRPGHYRYAAALSETYQYIFSKAYLQNAVDCAGPMHTIQMGAGAANPSLSGGAETGKTYSLDVGLFGTGTLGTQVDAKDLAVFYAPNDGCSLLLTDSGGSSSPILLVVAGSANPAAGPVLLQFGSTIQRPIVLVCFHAQLEAPPDSKMNGALLLDRDCTVAPAIGPITVGHLSYWAGGTIPLNTFRIAPMPREAENLVPRAIYVATAKSFL